MRCTCKTSVEFGIEVIWFLGMTMANERGESWRDFGFQSKVFLVRVQGAMQTVEDEVVEETL